MTVISFYYDKEQNVFENEDGRPIFNIFEYISPAKLESFKNRSEDGGVWHHKPSPDSEVVYEFMFPYQEEGFDY